MEGVILINALIVNNLLRKAHARIVLSFKGAKIMVELVLLIRVLVPRYFKLMVLVKLVRSILDLKIMEIVHPIIVL